MSAEREKEADKLMKKAQKEIGPSLLDFRFKPDYDSAAPMFERAAVIYKVHVCVCVYNVGIISVRSGPQVN